MIIGPQHRLHLGMAALAGGVKNHWTLNMQTDALFIGLIPKSYSATCTCFDLSTETISKWTLLKTRYSECRAYSHYPTYPILSKIMLNQIIQKFQWSQSSSCWEQWTAWLLASTVKKETWPFVHRFKTTNRNGHCWKHDWSLQRKCSVPKAEPQCKPWSEKKIVNMCYRLVSRVLYKPVGLCVWLGQRD